MKKQIISNTSQDTIELARKIGHRLRGGEVIVLKGDLGSGKTTFVSGLVDGAGSHDVVSSPTFMITKVYTTPKLKINHFDFYRLSKADLIEHELEEHFEDEASVKVIEWPSMLNDVLPKDRLTLHFNYLEDASKRCIDISCSDKLKYLVE